MEALESILRNIAAAGPVLVPILYTLFIAAILDTLSGLWAAWQSSSLNAQFVAEFLRSHVLTKIIPILLQLLAGVGLGGTDNAAGLLLLATTGASAAAYLTSVIASIGSNVKEGNAKTKGLPEGVVVSTAVAGELVELDAVSTPTADEIASAVVARLPEHLRA